MPEDFSKKYGKILTRTDAAPMKVREDVRKVAPYLEIFVLMNDDPDHGRICKLLRRGFNIEAVRELKDQIQQATNELLVWVRDRGRFDVCREFAFLLPA